MVNKLFDVNSLVEKIRQAIDKGKTVKMTLENSGVHSGYKLQSWLTISCDGEILFDDGEKVNYGGPMWYSNYTGANVEKIYFYIKDALVDYIYKCSEDHRSGYHAFTTVFYRPAK